jgi:hypothetical protein
METLRYLYNQCKLIMKEGYYITADGEKEILKPCNIIDVSSMEVIYLHIPEGARSVSCFNNQLTYLHVPEGCKYLDCEDNRLRCLCSS